MSKVKEFLEKANGNTELREKYNAILKKHEATKDRDAAAAELAELAKAEGFNISPDEILSTPHEKGEISEEQLESISGGGSPVATCGFANGLILYGPSIRIRKIPNEYDAYETLCQFKGGLQCTWFGCRCWGVTNCKDGWHRCDEKGRALEGHGIADYSLL